MIKRIFFLMLYVIVSSFSLVVRATPPMVPDDSSDSNSFCGSVGGHEIRDDESRGEGHSTAHPTAIASE
jgi:hypothetical protein